MARVKEKTYTADELQKLKRDLERNDAQLVEVIREQLDISTTDAAMRLRDAAGCLVNTRWMLEQDGNLMNAMQLVRHTGEPQRVPGLDECWLADEDDD